MPDGLYTSEIDVKFTEDMAAAAEADFAAGKVYTKSDQFNEMVDRLGIVSVTRIFGEDERFAEREHRAGLHLWYRVKLERPSGVTMTKASEELSSIPGIQESSPVMRKKIADFNDPGFGQQWGLYQSSGIDINVSRVWEEFGTGSSDVIVSVIDTGVDLEHEDLAANAIPAGRGGSMNFRGSAPTSSITPGDHGTHVAGVISAVNNNNVGVSGIAGGDAAQGTGGVRLLSCQVGDNDAFDGNTEDAIRYAANNGALICQNSWGYNFDYDDNGVLSASEIAAARETQIGTALKAAVDYFIDYAGCDNAGNQLPDSPMKGGIVIFAAGNDAIQYGPPANYERILAVGSIDRNGSRSSFSNYGDWVDICAPGGDIYSTLPNNRYGSMSGTSMACPHVSGVAALLVSELGGPGFTNEMLWDRLVGGANSDAAPSVAGRNIGPLLDAYGAFTYGGTTPPERVEDYTAEGFGGLIDFSWTVTADEDNGKAYGYFLLVSENRSLLENIDPSDIPSGVHYVTVPVGDLEAGDGMTGAVSGLEFATQYYVAIVGYDYQRNYSELSEIKEVATTQNNAPVIGTAETGAIELRSHETFTRSYTVADPDGHSIELNFTPGSAAATFPEGSTTDEYVLTIVGNAAEAGRYEAVISAEDEYGAVSTETIAYVILENHAPVAAAGGRDVMLQAMGQSSEVAMSELVTDEDGEQLTWSISNTAPTTVHASISSNTLYLTALSYGNAQVTITGTDCRGEKASATVNVIVKNPDSPLEVYPNPVSDYLSVRTMEEMDTRVMITTSTGATVYDETAPVSVFNPAVIDMRNCAPGQYRVYVSFGGNEYTRTVVKL